jgi:hypothetical protein
MKCEAINQLQSLAKLIELNMTATDLYVAESVFLAPLMTSAPPASE